MSMWNGAITLFPILNRFIANEKREFAIWIMDFYGMLIKRKTHLTIIFICLALFIFIDNNIINIILINCSIFQILFGFFFILNFFHLSFSPVSHLFAVRKANVTSPIVWFLIRCIDISFNLKCNFI